MNNHSSSHAIGATLACVMVEAFVHYAQKKMMLMPVSIVRMLVMVARSRQCVSGVEYLKSKRVALAAEV